ncbi:MAG: DNA polymerase III subunit gamma/tau [Bdellovibrionales bacterium]|nr:DNA polymerase III subunit gamma/tau [Bdellovibrionales bacterium]
MGSYVVLARKWRPSQFSDIGGQGPVVRTLMNAIQSDRIHHAYLLTGSRGIGKTSIARIFAKAIRCPNAKWDGQWLRSCGECSSCKEIAAGNSVDVIEIDGASNNGVDAVREIRENAKFMPSSGTRKIYIIDEVHMLTTAAFNALLKTLEEPPAHVIFVLATTEPHKIPGTILSRCQRFDLKRFTAAQIQTRLEEVSTGEEISIEPAATALLARAADGSMRDALSLFDQVIAYTGKKITAAAVRESIGLIESQTQLGILRGIFARDPKAAIELVGEAYRAGHELKLLAKNLLEYLHAAILIKIGVESTGLELAAEEVAELKKIAAHRELEEIELFFQAFQNGIEWIARSPQPKLVLEVLIVKCASAETLVSIAGPTSGSAGGTAPGNGRPTGTATTGSAGTSRVAHTAPKVAPEIPASTPAAPGALPKASLLFTGSSPLAMKKTATPVSETISNLGASRAPAGPKSFEGFISHVRGSRPAIANALENAICDQFPTTIEQDFVVVFSPSNADLYHGLLTSVAALSEFQKFTLEYFGVVKRVLVEVRETRETSLAEKREKEFANREKMAKDAAANHPIIAEARSLFGGELGPIEFDEGEKK